MDNLRVEVIDRLTAAILASKTPAERVAMVGDAHRTARILIAAGVRHIHPDWDEEKVQSEVAHRMIHGAT